MKKKRNCWEVMKCGREPGGEKADELGVCPAAQPSECDGMNQGQCGGRICWFVAGTLCHGEIQGTYAEKFHDCLHCEFLKEVNEDEGREFILRPIKEKNDQEENDD